MIRNTLSSLLGHLEHSGILNGIINKTINLEKGVKRRKELVRVDRLRILAKVPRRCPEALVHLGLCRCQRRQSTLGGGAKGLERWHLVTLGR